MLFDSGSTKNSHDLLEGLKLDLKYSASTIKWANAEIPMRSRDAPRHEGTVGRVERILDAKYEPVDLDEVVSKKRNHFPY